MSTLESVQAVLERLRAVALLVIGVVILSTGYPPQGGETLAFLIVGGVAIVAGVIGLFQPKRLRSSQNSHHSME